MVKYIQSHHLICYILKKLVLSFSSVLLLTVRPDPPVSLNWTLLNISPSWLSYDIMVNWDPPPSADVGAGWMRVEYEIQYRERNKTNWETVSLLNFQIPLSYILKHAKMILGSHKW